MQDLVICNWHRLLHLPQNITPIARPTVHSESLHNRFKYCMPLSAFSQMQAFNNKCLDYAKECEFSCVQRFRGGQNLSSQKMWLSTSCHSNSTPRHTDRLDIVMDIGHAKRKCYGVSDTRTAFAHCAGPL